MSRRDRVWSSTATPLEIPLPTSLGREPADTSPLITRLLHQKMQNRPNTFRQLILLNLNNAIIKNHFSLYWYLVECFTLEFVCFCSFFNYIIRRWVLWRWKCWIEVCGPLFAGPGQSAANPVCHPGGLWRLYLSGAGQHWEPRTSCPPGIRLCVCHFIIFT